METVMSRSLRVRLVLLAVTMTVLMLAPGDSAQVTSASVIVQGADMASAAQAVRQVGGEVTHELGIINAVGAELTAEQRRALVDDAFRVMADRGVSVAGAKKAKVGRDPDRIIPTDVRTPGRSQNSSNARAKVTGRDTARPTCTVGGFGPTIRKPTGDGRVATQPSGEAILLRPGVRDEAHNR